MRHAKRPLFYTGGGVVNSGPEASHFLRELVKLTGFPITSTLMGLGAYAASDPQWLGMLGMHGTYEANLAMHDCDVMICIGARFDDRITGRLEENPRRHRSVLDQQERQGRHSDHRRLRPRARGHGAAVALDRDACRQGGACGLVEADRQMARAPIARL
jgi:thiamine pyrophosphate-dependent acetolactate synthase large subunit-like protein